MYAGNLSSTTPLPKYDDIIGVLNFSANSLTSSPASFAPKPMYMVGFLASFKSLTASSTEALVGAG